MQVNLVWCRFAEQQRLQPRRRPPPLQQRKVRPGLSITWTKDPWTHHHQWHRSHCGPITAHTASLHIESGDGCVGMPSLCLQSSITAASLSGLEKWCLNQIPQYFWYLHAEFKLELGKSLMWVSGLEMNFLKCYQPLMDKCSNSPWVWWISGHRHLLFISRRTAK